MKRIVYTLGLCLGILCFSCESNQNSNKDALKKASDNKVVNTTSKKIEITKIPGCDYGHIREKYVSNSDLSVYSLS